jgi:hypothetical protein
VTLGRSGAADWQWISAEGTALKAAPAGVREREKDALKELQAVVEGAGKSALAQRNRVERLMISDREIPLAAWRERYVEHPLVSPYARRLIWQFTTGEVTKPGDRSLCVVPDRASREAVGRVYVPFEGDSVFTLILEKAFLLANDARIKDAAVRKQIKAEA